MRHLFLTYFDIFSRLKVLVPLTLGVVLAGIAVITSPYLWLQGLALLCLADWGYVYWRYRKNRKLYMTQGHGPLPAGSWVNPPAEALQPGDLILTSGRIATQLHESVGHGELVVRGHNGEMLSFSSYMERGCVLNPLADVAGAKQNHGFFVVLRLRQPFSEKQSSLALDLVDVMLQQNIDWRAQETARRAWLLNAPWLPKAIKSRLKVTGYDWMGLLTGRRAANRWTCIGACLELYWRLGITVKQYGTGLLGLGTGLFDPIMPVRFLNDPAFRILTEQDKQDYESKAAA